MTQLKITEYAVGFKFENYALLLADISSHTAKNGKPYAKATFQDPTGKIIAHLWEVTPAQTLTLTKGTVFTLTGEVEKYNEVLQLKLSALTPLPQADPRSNPVYYLKAAPIRNREIVEGIQKYMNELNSLDPQIGEVISTIINEQPQKYFQYPASKTLHHAFVGGLAYHTLRMLQSAEVLMRIYPNINQALVYASILLHDIGKIEELSGIIGTDYTVQGRLIGHICSADAMLIKTLCSKNIDINDKKFMELRHIILSHHGEVAYGSPVTPASKEAILVHQLDALDARINAYDVAVENVENGTQTNKNHMFDNKTLYKA